MKFIYVLQQVPEPYESYDIYGYFESFEDSLKSFKNMNNNDLGNYEIVKIEFNTFLEQGNFGQVVWNSYEHNS